MTFRTISERVVHSGHIFTLSVAEFESPTGERFERDVVRHPGAVAVVPVIDDDVILVRQYRPAIGIELLEIPAGLRDVDGEPLEQTAARELQEEIGYAAGTLTPLVSTHNAVGFSDEQIHIFIGDDLEPVDRVVTDSPEEQEMEMVRLPIAEAVSMIADGRITDAKTIIGLQALSLSRHG